MRDQAYQLLLKLEGGFQESNLHGDPGGRTFAGITSKTWFDWNHKIGKNATWPPTEKQVEEFYDQAYWFPFNCHLMPAPVDAVYLQIIVNLPPVAARQVLQNALGTLPDGKIGPSVLSLLTMAVPDYLSRALLVAQAQHYCDIRKTTDPLFNGLQNRVRTVRKELLL